MSECTRCAAARESSEARVAELERRLAEASRLIELQQADLDRCRAELERQRPNRPERVAPETLQLAFAEALIEHGPPPEGLAASVSEPAGGADDTAEGAEGAAPESPSAGAAKPRGGRSRHRRGAHGRRRLSSLASLPVQDIPIEPEEVRAAGGQGFERIGEEVSERVAYRPGGYVRVRVIRGKWRREPAAVELPVDESTPEVAPIVIAPLPDNVTPRSMGDASATANVAVTKYGDLSPLHRQERISERQGFRLSRSTQCSWLGAGYADLYRIHEAMFDESKARAHCIATDATSVPVRSAGECEGWHIFVFIADLDHIVFRYAFRHTSEAVSKMLDGFAGILLADAAVIYDALYRDGRIIEAACWAHLRRYVYRALATDQKAALQGLALIGRLFEIQARGKSLGLPLDEFTRWRAERARPVIEVFERWVASAETLADPRSPLMRAVTYYRNQREALHRFLENGRLRIDNNISEQQLRAVVLGRHNWTFFANETGLRWYTVYRSLIASCALHGINPHEYLETVLRLAPHWNSSRMIELAPKYFRETMAGLDSRWREISEPVWLHPDRRRLVVGEPDPIGAAA